MESNKFEDSIREKLESRKLQPSSNAWTQLSERLDNENKKQNNKAAWWIGIAASVIGILFIGFQFFNTEEVKPVIVDSPMIIEQNANPPAPVEQIEKPNTVLEKIKKTQLKESKIAKNKDYSIVVAEDGLVPKEEIQEQKTIAVKQESLTFEVQKIQDVVAQIQKQKANNQEVSDDDIDALLRQAQKEIRYNQLYNKATGVVDANLLLEDVETDLDQSFRSKVIESIKASYRTVKTVVAQRNN